MHINNITSSDPMHVELHTKHSPLPRRASPAKARDQIIEPTGRSSRLGLPLLHLFLPLRPLPKPTEQVIESRRRRVALAAPEHVFVPRRGALNPRDPVEDVVVVDRLVVHRHGRVLRLGQRGRGGGGLLVGVEDGVEGGRRRRCGLGRRSWGGRRRAEEVVVRGRGGGGGRRGGSGAAGPGGSGGPRGSGRRHGRGFPRRAEAEVAGQQALEVVHTWTAPAAGGSVDLALGRAAAAGTTLHRPPIGVRVEGVGARGGQTGWMWIWADARSRGGGCRG